jgi:leucyl/phenylalanyl-tRNA--protein transferase
MPVYLLTDELAFPPVDLAEPEGILAVGGDLSVERLLLAYQSGIFPWYSEGEPILWWSPDPRCVLFPCRLKVSDSMKRIIKSGRFRVTFDREFRRVMGQCGTVRRKRQAGTWITGDMLAAYCRLHDAGYAHSVETWLGRDLVGGLYGVSLGSAFFGESMFSRVPNASKVALVELVWRLKSLDFTLIDCQLRTEHLVSLGAGEIPRAEYIDLVGQALERDTLQGIWSAWTPGDGAGGGHGGRS